MKSIIVYQEKSVCCFNQKKFVTIQPYFNVIYELKINHLLMLRKSGFLSSLSIV